jgi:hypothetical protein
MASAASRPPTSTAARLIDPAAKDAFWMVVEDCLVRLHRIDTLGAIHKARVYRRAAEANPHGALGDVVYHAEPFFVACEIAGMDDLHEQEAFLTKHRSAYESFLKIQCW